jgi:hypothetical protein
LAKDDERIRQSHREERNIMPRHECRVREEVDIHGNRPSILISYKREKQQKTKLVVTGALR